MRHGHKITMSGTVIPRAEMELAATFVLCGIVAAGWWLWVWWRKNMVYSSSDSSRGAKIPNGSMGWPLIGESYEFIACGRASKPMSFMHRHRNL